MSTVIAVTYFVISVSWADGITFFGSFVLAQLLSPPPLSIIFSLSLSYPLVISLFLLFGSLHSAYLRLIYIDFSHKSMVTLLFEY